MMNLTPLAMAWGGLAVIVAGLALMRRGVTATEDDSIHLSGGDAVSHQVEIAKRVQGIDKWGKVLTVALAIYGVILLVLYGIQLWQTSSNAGLA